MKKLKVLAASVALALGATSASAALTNTTGATGSSLFLTAWVNGVVTYARNLGLTMGNVLNDTNPNVATTPNAAWVSESGALFDKNVFGSFAGDANWTASGLAAAYGTNVQFTITAGEAGAAPSSHVSTYDFAGFTSPGTKSDSEIVSAVSASTLGGFILGLTAPANFPGNPPDNSCLANNSCYSSWAAGNPATADGAPFGANWTGDSDDSAGENSEGLGFWYYRALGGSFTERTPIQFRNSMNAGQWFLESDGDVRYELAAAIPVPAAVWLFGSGLLGFAAVARRRKSAAGAQFA
jgi:hypothetical protein